MSSLGLTNTHSINNYDFDYLYITVFRPRPPPKKIKKKSEIRPSAAPLAKYPDASRWKVADVVNFFVKLGFKEQSSSFQDQVCYAVVI